MKHNGIDLWIQAQLGQIQNVAYALIDENLIVLTKSENIYNWIEEDVSDITGISLADVFPELIGIETFLQKLAINQSEEYVIPKIYRPNDTILGKFFTMYISPFFQHGKLLLVTLVDVTLQSELEQSLRQERNELRLNILKQKRIEKALYLSQQRYTLIEHGVNDGLWDWDLQTDKIYFSVRWKSMLGYNDDDIGDNPNEWFQLIHKENLEEFKSQIDNHVTGKSEYLKVEYRIFHKDGHYRWMLCRGMAVRDKTGKSYRMAGSQTDVTQNKEFEQQLYHSAFHDSLTGLPNRAFFMKILESVFEKRYLNPNKLNVIFFLDLDHFKVVNDSLGHLVGDQLLIIIAQRLTHCIRAGDAVFRLGGDEFIVLLNNVVDIDEVRQIAEHVQAEIAKPVMLSGHDIFPQVSIGISLITENYKHAEELLRDADTAMYKAKAAGRGQHQLFEPTQHDNAIFRFRLEGELRQALEQKEFQIYYQPIISLKDKNIVGVEGLLRWQHPEHGLLKPSSFMAVAEESGLVMPISDWVLETIYSQLAIWHEMGYTALRASVNLFPHQLEDSHLLKLLNKVLNQTNLPPQSIEIDIIQQTLPQDAKSIVSTMNALVKEGIQISADDFGIGSSLTHLNQLPFHRLKIDKSFISDLTDRGKIITEAIIMMAHGLKLSVIAEGVETEEQLAFLCSQNCDEAQGFLFSPPMPAHALTKFLEKKCRTG